MLWRRKMHKRYVLALLGLLLAIPLSGQWHRNSQVTITKDQSYTNQSGGKCVTADDEYVHFVWKDITFEYSQVRHWFFPIGFPLATATGNPLDTSDGVAPVISRSGAGIHFDWHDGTLYFRELAGGMFYPILQHGWSETSGSYPAIADDAAGNTHCAFVYSDMTYGFSIAYQKRPSGNPSFNSAVQVTHPPSGYTTYFPYLPTICLAPDNSIHVAWPQPWNASMGYATSTDGASWTVSEIPNITCNYNYAPSLCSDKYGRLYLAYVAMSNEVYVITKTASGWGSPFNVSFSFTGGKCGTPSICCDTLGRAFVVWHMQSGGVSGGDEIWYNTNRKGFWSFNASRLTSLDCRPSRYPSISPDLKGNVHVVWADSGKGNYDICYNWFLGVPSGRDVAVLRIDRPSGVVSASVPPRVVVANYGTTNEVCRVRCTITGPHSQYDALNNGGNKTVSSGDEVEFDFPMWEYPPSSNAGDIYKITATAYLMPDLTLDDDDSTNNVMVDFFTIYGRGVAATTILKPEEGESVDTMKPAAYFTNIGTEPVMNFYCRVDIPSSGGQTPEYKDSVLIADSLYVGDSLYVEFSDWIAGDNGSYTATFHATSATPDTLYSPHEKVDFKGMYETGVAEKHEETRLEIASPGLCTGAVAISYILASSEQVGIRIYDVTGKLVCTLYQGELSGKGTLYWDGRDSNGSISGEGLYFVRIVSASVNRTQKVLLVH